MNSKDIDVLDAALGRVLRLAYMEAARADSFARENGLDGGSEQIVGGAENVLRKWLLGTPAQYEQACKREGYGLTKMELH